MLVDLGRAIDPARASILGIVPARNPAFVFEFVEQLAERRLLDFGHLGEFRLRQPVFALQRKHHAPLRPREPDSGQLVLKTFSKETMNVLKQPPQRVLHLELTTQTLVQAVPRLAFPRRALTRRL